MVLLVGLCNLVVWSLLVCLCTLGALLWFVALRDFVSLLGWFGLALCVWFWIWLGFVWFVICVLLYFGGFFCGLTTCWVLVVCDFACGFSIDLCVLFNGHHIWV